MMSKQDNERLCRTGPDTPMGKMLRRYWHPVLRSQRLEADGAPQRVRLLGEDFVAFRSTDGRIGFFDESCPHRCASLALARNEGNGLRCIFHGWKFDVSGKVVEVPTEEPERQEEFCKKVPLRHYPVKEAGGIVWVCIDREQAPPKFPNFEFLSLGSDQIDARLGIIKCNWVQALESVLDSAHLSFLHSGLLKTRTKADSPMSEGMRANFSATAAVTSPRFEILEKPYGFREAALRNFPDGRVFTKIREFVAPYFSFLPGFPEQLTRRILVVSVPLDDYNCAQWIINYRVDGPFIPGEIEDFWKGANQDPDNFLNISGDFSDMWGQDRKAMAEGHFSGFPGRQFFEEDMIVQESMGPIVDRSREFLSSSDKVIVYVRKMLLEGSRRIEQGGAAWGHEAAADIDYSRIRSCALFLPKGDDWKKVDSFELAARQAA